MTVNVFELFLEQTYRKLDDKIAEQKAVICNGQIATIESYKQFYGRIEGLTVAYNIMKEMYSKYVLNESTDKKDESNARKESDREFY